MNLAFVYNTSLCCWKDRRREQEEEEEEEASVQVRNGGNEAIPRRVYKYIACNSSCCTHIMRSYS